MFAAFFGFGVSRALHVYNVAGSEEMTTTRSSNIFSLLGTLFLWIFWPSFMSSGAQPGRPQQRAMMNTYSSILSSVLATFVVSALSNPQGKLHIDHIQNAVLAGGVSVGAVADILLEPYVSIILGLLGGVVSTCGFLFLPDLFTYKLRIHDTCSVHSLHALPGTLGGLASALYALGLSQENYGSDWANLFPAMAEGRTGLGQAAAQLAAMATTIGLGLLGGLLTGLVMRAAGALQWSGGDIVCPAGPAGRFDDNFSFIIQQSEQDKSQVEQLGNWREKFRFSDILD